MPPFRVVCGTAEHAEEEDVLAYSSEDDEEVAGARPARVGFSQLPSPPLTGAASSLRPKPRKTPGPKVRLGPSWP